MYLRGLGECTASYRIKIAPGAQCPSPAVASVEFDKNNNRTDYCNFPPMCSAPPPAPTANITTTVSPQISPNLIQQQQPTNSPVNASTDQANETAPSSTGNNAGYQQLLDLLAAQQASQPAPSPYTPAYSGGSPATVIAAPEPSQVANVGTDNTKYFIYAAIALGGIFLLKNQKGGNRVYG